MNDKNISLSFISARTTLGEGWDLADLNSQGKPAMVGSKSRIFLDVAEKKWCFLEIILEAQDDSISTFKRICAFLNGIELLYCSHEFADKFVCLKYFIGPQLQTIGENELVLHCLEAKKGTVVLHEISMNHISIGEVLCVQFPLPPGHEQRKAFFLPAGESHVLHLEVDHCAAMSFAYAFHFRPPVPGAHLRLTSHRGREEKLLWEREISLDQAYVWHDVAIDLADFKAHGTSLQFTILGGCHEASRDGEFGIFISKPILYEPLSSKNKTRRNVIVVSLDTVRSDRLSAYGYERKTSPNLEEMAKKGIRFAQARTAATWTYPAHASLFTGLHSSRLLSASRNSTKENLFCFRDGLERFPETLAALFQANGYLTAASTGNGWVDGSNGFLNGFMRYANLPLLPEAKDKSADIFGRAITWVKEVCRKSPFFLFLHTYEAHWPHFHDYFVDRSLNAGRILQFQDFREYPQIADPTVEERQFAADLYDSSILHADRYIGLLMEQLEEMKVLDQTVLIVLSDHGEDLWDHTQWGHGEMYEESLRIPLIFYNLPGSIPGSVIQEPVSILDIYPTLMEVLETKRFSSYPLDGISLLPLLEGKPMPRQAIYGEYANFASNQPERYATIISGNYKYILRRALINSPPSHETQDEKLFSLEEDPFEKKNLSEEMPDLLKSLRQKCKKLLFSVSHGPHPTGNDSATYSPSEELRLVQRLKALGYL